MGRRSWMEDVKVTVEVGDCLPVYEFEALKEIIKKVALRVLKDMEEGQKEAVTAQGRTVLTNFSN